VASTLERSDQSGQPRTGQASFPDFIGQVGVMDLLTMCTPIRESLMGGQHHRLFNQFILKTDLIHPIEHVQVVAPTAGTHSQGIGVMNVCIGKFKPAFVLGVSRLSSPLTLSPTFGSRFLGFDDVRGRGLGRVRGVLACFGQCVVTSSPSFLLKSSLIFFQSYFFLSSSFNPFFFSSSSNPFAIALASASAVL